MVDLNTTRLLDRLERLEEKVKTLEAYQAYRRNFLSLNEGQVVFRTQNGDASLTMKKDGSIVLEGVNIELKSQRHIQIKALQNVQIKGAKVAEN